jgi:hypothetical protein
LLNGVVNAQPVGMLRTDLLRSDLASRQAVAAALRQVANDLPISAPVLPSPQAPGKSLPSPQAPGKSLPSPQAPGKSLPSPQAPGKSLPTSVAFSVRSTISEISVLALQNLLNGLANQLDSAAFNDAVQGDKDLIKERALQALGLVSLVQNPL